MRFKTLIFIACLLMPLAIQAQDSEFPTLDALANLEIPGYSFVDMVRRLSWQDANYTPPANPPVYEIGDRETFMLPIDAVGGQGATPVELRGQTENVLIWVEESANYTRFQAQALAERVDDEILLPLRQLFEYTEPPGIDGDPRLMVVIFHEEEFPLFGGFARAHTYPRTLFRDSNQRELVLVNLDIGGRFLLNDDEIIDIIAHEHQHVLLHHRDFDEVLWLNEALSSFADYYTPGMEVIVRQAKDFLEAPDTGLRQFYLVDDKSLKYGAGALFLVFLAEQYGNDVIRRLHAENADDWLSVEKVLRESPGVSADEVFADWVLANHLQNASIGYGYQSLDAKLIPPQPVATLRNFPALHSGRLPQYSSDYLNVSVRGAHQLSLRLTQAPQAHLIDTAPYEGDFFFYAATAHASASRLTRPFDLRNVREALLEFRLWYNLSKHNEYAYVEVSADAGETWSILQGEHTEGDDDFSRFYHYGYNGKSDGWLQERVDLGYYTGQEILIRFEVMTDAVTNYLGLTIDDLRIDAINFHDGFESHDDAWIAEGWIRTDNRLPQRTWLQVVQETPEGFRLDRHMMTASGDIIVDLLPAVSQVLIAISPVVPQTSLETEYALEVNLIDADGNAIAAARECTVTTTHGLNFRDAPNGDKIGLLPQGTTALALDLRDGWFMVEYDGKRGWISGDYVTTRGYCE